MWVEWHCWLLVTQINFPPFWSGGGGAADEATPDLPRFPRWFHMSPGESTSRLLRRCICLKIVVMLLLCKAGCQERRAPTCSLPPTHDIASHRFHLISPFVRGAIITTAIINKICWKIPWLLCSPTKELALQTPKKLVVLVITEIRVLTSILDNRQIQPFHMSHAHLRQQWRPDIEIIDSKGSKCQNINGGVVVLMVLSWRDGQEILQPWWHLQWVFTCSFTVTIFQKHVWGAI